MLPNNVWIMFIGTAALFIFGTLACLWHLWWMRRLPALSEITIAEGASLRSTIRCSIVVAARNEEMRVEHTVRRLLAQTHVEVELMVEAYSGESIGSTIKIMEKNYFA